MRNRTILSIALAATLTGGCNFQEVASAASVAVGLIPMVTAAKGSAASPVAGVSRESYLDTNRLYVSVATRGGAAFKSGILAASTDADVQHPNFCKMVIDETAVVTDAGGLLAAADCRAEEEVQRLENALDAGDPIAFASAKGRASGFIADMEKIISTAEKGSSE